MTIYGEVLAWASGLPPWRQDALRRLCIQGKWNDADLAEILDLTKQHHGIGSELDPAPQPVPFANDHFPAEANQDVTVVLTSLHNLINVGKIPSSQILEFQPQGLTIAYGGNGTGKSCTPTSGNQRSRSHSQGSAARKRCDEGRRVGQLYQHCSWRRIR